MEKSEILQQWIEGAIPDPFLFQQRRAVYTHLLGTAHFAAMLAMKRGADSEAAELAGLLHDISTYLTGEHEGRIISTRGIIIMPTIVPKDGSLDLSLIHILCAALGGSGAVAPSRRALRGPRAIASS